MNNSIARKNLQEYLWWWHKNRNTMHTLYLENPKILDRHPAKDLPFQEQPLLEISTSMTISFRH